MREWGVSVGYWVPIWENKKVLETDGGDGCAIMWMYLMSLYCTLINGYDGNFILYVFYHN